MVRATLAVALHAALHADAAPITRTPVGTGLMDNASGTSYNIARNLFSKVWKAQTTMRRQQPQDSSFDEMDEHDAPTEPMMPVAIAPFLATQTGNTAQPARYPHLPPAQVKKNGHGGQRPPGGASPSPTSSVSPTSAASPVYPVLPVRPAKQAQPKRSPIPTFVGTFFVFVQLLLLVRFLLKLLSMPGNSGWVGIVYTVSGLFVFPFRLLLQNIALSLPVSVEVFTLLAILVYGLFSRILVRFLKALLNSR